MKTHLSTKIYPTTTTPFSLTEGMNLEIGGTHLRLLNLRSGIAVIQNLDTKEVREARESDLIDRLFTGELKSADVKGISGEVSVCFGDDTLAQVVGRGESDAAASVMLEQFRWVNSLNRIGIDRIQDKPWVRTAITRLSQSEMRGARVYKISTLIKVARLLQRSKNDPLAVLPRFSARGGRGIHRINKVTERVTTEVIEEVKAQNGKIVVKEILVDINTRISQLNLVSPEAPAPLAAPSTVTRRVKAELSAYEMCKRNQGKAVASREFRANGYSRDSATFPLETVAYDDTDTGVFLINQISGLPFGRAHLTSGIDQCTLMIMGFELSHKNRSIESAIGAIADSLLPKDCSKPEFQGMTHEWEGYGTPGTILLDNARYNGSAAIERQSDLHQLLLAKARPYSPTEKSEIEHFNHHVKDDFCTRIPGWRGEKHDADSIKEGIASAICTEIQFRSMFVKWATGVYSNAPGVDGLTPVQRWSRFYRRHRPAVRWSRDQLALLRLVPMTLKLRASGGLQRLGLRYCNAQLDELRRRIGPNAEVELFVDRQNLSHVIVSNPQNSHLFKVPCSEQPVLFQGITEYQQKLILKLAKQRGAANPSLAALVAAREELRKLTMQLALSKKMRSRKKVELIGHLTQMTHQIGSEQDELNSGLGSRNISVTPARVITELEWEIEQLETSIADNDMEMWGQ